MKELRPVAQPNPGFWRYILINNWKRRESLIFEKVWNFHSSSKLNKIRIKSTTPNKNHFRLGWRCDVCWIVSKLTPTRRRGHILHLPLIPTKLIEHPLISQLFSNCVKPAFSWRIINLFKNKVNVIHKIKKWWVFCKYFLSKIPYSTACSRFASILQDQYYKRCLPQQLDKTWSLLEIFNILKINL